MIMRDHGTALSGFACSLGNSKDRGPSLIVARRLDGPFAGLMEKIMSNDVEAFTVEVEAFTLDLGDAAIVRELEELEDELDDELEKVSGGITMPWSKMEWT
jgi:hypothetical protein